MLSLCAATALVAPTAIATHIHSHPHPPSRCIQTAVQALPLVVIHCSTLFYHHRLTDGQVLIILEACLTNACPYNGKHARTSTN